MYFAAPADWASMKGNEIDNRSKTDYSGTQRELVGQWMMLDTLHPRPAHAINIYTSINLSIDLPILVCSYLSIYLSRSAHLPLSTLSLSVYGKLEILILYIYMCVCVWCVCECVCVGSNGADSTDFPKSFPLSVPIIHRSRQVF